MIIKPEPMRMLAQTIDIRPIRQRRLHPQILILKDKRVRRGVEQHLVRRRAVDGEGEGRLSVVEVDFCCVLTGVV